jgi:hypothetical protein
LPTASGKPTEALENVFTAKNTSRKSILSSNTVIADASLMPGEESLEGTENALDNA